MKTCDAKRLRERDECLNKLWFTSLVHVLVVVEAWHREYNKEFPNKVLAD